MQIKCKMTKEKCWTNMALSGHYNKDCYLFQKEIKESQELKMTDLVFGSGMMQEIKMRERTERHSLDTIESC